MSKSITRWHLALVGLATALLFPAPPALSQSPVKDSAAHRGSKPVVVPTTRDGFTVTVSGTVADEKGAPLPDVDVFEIGYREATVVARSDAAGAFTVELPRMQFRKLFWAKSKRDSRQGYVYYDQPRQVRSPKPLRLVLRAAREMAVSVADAAHHPVNGATVAVTPIGQHLPADRSVTDAQGQAILHVAAGMPLAQVVAFKAGEGLDYVLFRRPATTRYTADFLNWDVLQRAQDNTGPIHFSFDGVRTAAIQVVDEQHRPLSSVEVRASINHPDRGGPLDSSAIDAFKGTTDSQGRVQFKVIPANPQAEVTFQSLTPEYFFPRSSAVEPSTVSSPRTVVAIRQQILRLTVTLPDGRPASHASVSMAIRGHHGGTALVSGGCHSDGVFTGIVIRPEQPYFVLSAARGQDAAPMMSGLAQPGQPLKPIRMVLQPATRVHGIVTVGKDRHPAPNWSVVLYQVDDGLYEKERASQRTPRSDPDPEPISVDLQHFGQADSQGRFEFYAAPGRYYLVGNSPTFVGYFTGGPERGYASKQMLIERLPGAPTLPVFEVKDWKIQPDVEVKLHVDVPEPVEIVGRIVQTSDPKQGVARANVQGFPLRLAPGLRYFRAHSDGSGGFHATVAHSDSLICAQSADRRLSGIVRIAAGQKSEIVVPIGPTATAEGRLVDGMGQPVAQAQLYYGTPFDYGDARRDWHFGSTVKTDQNGKFKISGLTLGWKFEINALASGERMQSVASVTADKIGPIQLGDVKLRLQGPSK